MSKSGDENDHRFLLKENKNNYWIIKSYRL